MADSTLSTRERLRRKLQELSISHGDFILASGERSSYYFDCRKTTLDPEGMHLVGTEVLALIRQQEQALGKKADAIGGLTMGADPISSATGLTSWQQSPERPLQVLVIRKEAKEHGKGKRIEGNFYPGLKVVVIDDVVTRGDSTLKAIDAIEEAGGQVAFVVVLVDREQGGCDKIRARGHHVFAVFTKSELLPS